MNKLFRYFLMVLLTALVSPSGIAWSAVSIQDVSIVDVTPSGFSIIWQTSESAVPGISIFSGPDGTTDITRDLETIPFPLQGGKPETIGEYEQEINLNNIRAQAKASGIMKIRVEGGMPNTTYYFRISSKGSDSTTIWWPTIDTLYSVTTTRENSFVADSKQILFTVNNQGGTYNTIGWLVIASSSETSFGVSSFVGDGALANQAFINLDNLFGPDGFNWTPTGLKEITIELRRGLGKTTINKTLSLDFSNNFSVSSLYSFSDECVPSSPPDEICDGMDNDCDGVVDNGFGVGAVCQSGVGACEISGVMICAANTLQTECNAIPDTPGEETCGDGIDNDCDGEIDEVSKGDINGDGVITPQDALTAFRYYLEIIQLDQCQKNSADVNNDGFVTPADAMCIFRKYIGVQSCLN